MKRINKTEKNFQKIWDDLDTASGLLFEALSDLNAMSGLSDDVMKSIESIDITAIVNLKNKIEELMK